MSHSELTGSRIAWVIPSVGPGSGGMRTILRHVEAATEEGCRCDVIVDDIAPRALSQAHLADYYGLLSASVFNDVPERVAPYDLVVATANTTVPLARSIPARHSCYFIQDFEPWFYPMGDDYLAAEQTYLAGLTPITIGRWLAHKLTQEYGLAPFHYDFCADLAVYGTMKEVRREHAVCILLQPDKPRRCCGMVGQVIDLLRILDPTLRIYTYGSAGNGRTHDPEVIDLGLISPAACADLYRHCSAGLCVSSSNPSRIPFEMMSCGLPVVDVYRENNLYDYCDSACVLADPSADALATAILLVANDVDKARDMREAGRRFMETRPMTYETDAFLDILIEVLSGTTACQADVPTKTIERHVAATPRSHALLLDQRLLAKRRARALADPIVGSRICVTIGNLTPPQGHGVVVPVWSDPAQKDIVWYPATRGDDGTWSFVIDPERHSANLVQYIIHVYTVDAGGGKHFVAAFSRWLAPSATAPLHTSEPDGPGTTGDGSSDKPSRQIRLGFAPVSNVRDGKTGSR